ncbi:hypothetical protein [Niabella aquatica]
MDTFFFRIFFGLFRLLSPGGVNMEQVRIIVSVKLLMDRRRTPATWKRSRQKETSNGMLIAMFFYALMGLFVGMLILSVPSVMLMMIILHSYLLFMLIMTLITDFSNVLLDTSDSQIILPRPVTSRTLLVARTLHIVVYLGQLVLAIMIFPLFFSFLKYGVPVGVFALLTTLLTTAIGIFLTYILYGLVLRYTSEQKVKDIIGYFQIFMTVFFVAGYQLIPRMISLSELDFRFELHWYSYLLPPVWMAGLLESVYTGRFDAAHIGLMICAVGVPVLAGFVIIKYLAPYFSKFMSAPADGAAKQNSKNEKHDKNSLSEKLGRIICRSDYERATFSQVWKMTGRDKSFKMQFYPNLAYIPVFIFIIFFKNFKQIDQTLAALPEGNMFLWLLYIGMFAVLLSLSLTAFYENYTAAWVYQSAPVSRPGELINGAAKSLLIKFFVPVFVILNMAVLIIWGAEVIDDILLAMANSLLIFYINILLSKHYLPFSQQPSIKEQTGKFVSVMLRFLLIAALVGLHWAAIKITWLVWVLVPVSLAGCWIAEKQVKDLKWNKIVV